VKDNVTSLDDPVTLEIAGDKPLVLRLLSARGIPVPRHIVVGHHDVAGAWTFVSRLGRPCVVKPALHGHAGAGVTTGVDDRRRLGAALAHAGAWSRLALVEEQVPGDAYRLLYLEGELLDAVRRRPPFLCGDGRSSIRRLIAAENAARAASGTDLAQSPLRRDADVSATLHRQGYSLRSVPPKGAAVRVKEVPNDNRRLDNEGAVDVLCPGIVATGAAAAHAVGVRLAGVDVITSDPEIPLERSGGVVIEVNTTPGFYYHYHRNGSAAPVATMILRRLAKGER
jgi:cyanophycin synthetase